MKTPAAPTDEQIAAYARHRARQVLSVRRVDPIGAARIEAEARAQCDAMYAAQRAARRRPALGLPARIIATNRACRAMLSA